MAKKKKQCTYTARKRKVRELRGEVRKLEFQLGAAMMKSSFPVVGTTNKGLQKAAALYAELLAVGRNNQLQLASAQSAISGCKGNYNSYPLHSIIRLGKNWDQRRDTLLSMKEEKLRTAYDFVMDPCRLLDHKKSTCSEDIFETKEGDWCCVRFETIQFPGVQSLEQVFDAVMSYFNNTELLISEKPGNFAMRDDYECLEGGIKNSRLIATNGTGTTTDSSAVVFSQMIDRNDRFGGKPIGIVAIDAVDEDELFPRLPTERVRQDGAGAIVLSATRTIGNDPDPAQDDNPTSSESNSSEGIYRTTVTMRRADFTKLYHPEFPLTVEAQHELHDRFTRSGEFMRKEIRRMVYHQN